ncbi:DUF7667 family protein [Paenibacillus odorifer]|uniref:DUF7667 family protein n=1 Tax=Paenibacillus sp. FSL L8-0506 TaxID=2975335 RepID=UPI0009701BD0|nr:hypothetical protein BJP48_29740 [Paenibacillus odorifer]
MLVAHQRLAEIFHENLKGPLSEELAIELQHCLHENAKYCWDYNTLNNQLIQARSTHDTNWEMDLLVKMDWLRRSGRLVKGY